MPKRILVVDDETQMVDMIAMRLESAGYEVLKAYNGHEGLEKARNESPDLIILDVMMPKMDGYKVCGLLKADGRFRKIPVLMFTARVQEADRQLSQEVGANGYLNKPLVTDELMSKVRELIGK